MAVAIDDQGSDSRKRRGAVGVEGLDGLQAPGLALLALGLGPDDRLPVRGEDEAGAGVGDFDAVAAGLVDVEEEGLLDGVLVRAGLDEDAVLEKDVGGLEDGFAAVEREGDVVEAAADAVGFAGVGEVVALVGGGEPHAGFGAVVEHDEFGGAEAEGGLEELAVGADVDGEAVEMVEPADVDAAAGDALRLVLERGAEVVGGLVPLGLVVDLEGVAVGVAEAVGGAVAEFAVAPAEAEAGGFEGGDPAVERLFAAGAEGGVAHAGGVRRGELEGVALVIVPAAEVDGVALAAALGHSHDIDEEAEQLLGLGCEQFEVAEMGHVHDRFVLHRTPR